MVALMSLVSSPLRFHMFTLFQQVLYFSSSSDFIFCEGIPCPSP